MAAELADLKRRVASEGGIDCDRFKPSFLRRRVAARMCQTEQRTLRDYLQFLDRYPDEYRRLVEAFSISVTRFFRDDSTFAFIRSKVLPALLTQRTCAARRPLKLWSAGCATGQEAYSLAMVVAEGLERAVGRIGATVHGTDIDAQAIAIARAGVYSPAEMEGVAGAYALRHFVASGTYLVAPEIRRLVHFRVHDLMKEPPLQHVDLLLCRNVLIYMSSASKARARVLDIFHTALRPGGFLVLGKTEAVGAEIRGRFLAVDVKERIYQKIHGGE